MTPRKKISQTLLEYLEPFLTEFGDDPTRQELENLLMVGTTVWNACVVDAWHGSETCVTEVRKQGAYMPHPELTEYLIQRKRTWGKIPGTRHAVARHRPIAGCRCDARGAGLGRCPGSDEVG